MNKKKTVFLALAFALAICLAFCLVACTGSSSGGKKATIQTAPKLASLTALRSNSTNEDTEHTMCLGIKNGECESVALVYKFDNAEGFSIKSITINGKEFTSDKFRVGSNALKVVIDYVPEATKGEFTLVTDKFDYESSGGNKSVTKPAGGELTFNIAPDFEITFDASSSAATEREDIIFTDTVEFMSEMNTMAMFYDETQMDDIGDYPYGKPGYGFAGWYTEPNGKGTQIDGNTVYDYYEGITLYAHYELYFTYKVVTTGDDDFDAEVAGEDESYIIITGTTTTGNKRSILTVTNEFDGVPVKELGARALINTKAGVVNFNSNLIKIGTSACQGLGATFSFDADCKVKIIGESAFSGATGLAKQTRFVIPSTVEVIAKNAFENCSWDYNVSNKKTLIIPNSVKSIGDKAFFNNSFENIYFESGSELNDETFGASVFENSLSLKSLCTSVTINDSNKIIKESTNGLKYIGVAAFKGAKELTLTQESLVEGLEVIGESAFSKDTKNIKELIIPDSLQTISTDAFTNSGLNKITFKNDGANSNLYTIGDYAFSSCTFGETAGTDTVDLCAPYLSTYGIAPFFGNTKLKVIKLKTDSVPTYMGNTTSYRDGGTYTKYYVPKSQVELYKQTWRIDIKTEAFGVAIFSKSVALPISAREDIITNTDNRQYALTINEGGETAILETVFAPSTGAETTITIPDTLTSGTKTYTIVGIGSYVAHENVTALNFAKSSNIKSIADYAFAGCKKLATVNFKSLTSLETIGERAFYMTGVTSFESGSDSLTTIGEDAFYLCSSLSTVKITHGTDVQIKEYAFCYSGVTEVVIGAEVKYIENGAFAFCDSLANVYLETNDNIHHKNTMTIGPFRSSAIGSSSGADAESGNSTLKIYLLNETVKGYLSSRYYYTIKTSGEVTHPVYVGSTYDEWRNFYAAYSDCYYVDATAVTAKVAD